MSNYKRQKEDSETFAVLLTFALIALIGMVATINYLIR